MDDSRAVGGGEPLHQLERDRRKLLRGQAAARLDAAAEALAVQKLHHQVAVASGQCAEVEHFDDVLGADASGGLGFALETRDRLALLGDRGEQHLDGDAPVNARVLALVDGTHAALADQADDPVLPIDDVARVQHPKVGLRLEWKE